MAKKSGGRGVGLVLVGGALALLASIPKEAWLTIGLILFFGALWYFAAKHLSNDSDATPSRPAVLPEEESRLPRSLRSSGNSDPVTVRLESQAEANHRLPSPPPLSGPGKWIAPGESVEVLGTHLAGGMVYVGTLLPAGGRQADPCLINTSKHIASTGSYVDASMGYWPSYSEISPEARRAYLNWLAGGRKDPRADIGFVFLFFYGLERRAIVDGGNGSMSRPAAQADFPAIADEVRRLLSIYGDKSSSFRRYGLEFLSLLDAGSAPQKLYERAVPSFARSYELPFYVRLALGQCAVDGAPVPPALALAWMRLDPNVSLRTPATRCAEHFDALFQTKYAELIPGGLVLPKNKTKLKFVYRPASAGLMQQGEIKVSFGDIPDVAVLTAPLNRLRAIVDAATDELDSYSRLVGKSAAAASSLEGLLLLPPTLWPAAAKTKLDSLSTKVSSGMTAMKLAEVAAALGGAASLERATVMSLARALEVMHIGMEPDVLNGAKTPKPEDTVVLFSLPAGEPVSRSNPAYQAAALTVQLGSAVAMADGAIGTEEVGQLRQQIEGWTHLTPAHQQRLRAHTRLIIDAPPSLAALKKKLEPLAPPAKEAIAKFMSVVAQADGQVSPAEIKMLEKVYAALGVDPKKVFSDVHAVAAAAPEGKRSAQTAPSTGPSKPVSRGFQLDQERIAALQQDTEKVNALLSSIFTEEPTEPAPVGPAPLPPETAPEAPFGLAGLDAAHIAFVNQLVSRPEWTREELMDLVSDLDLMLDGALERVNEAAFDAHDSPLTEGDDPVTINREILEKSTA